MSPDGSTGGLSIPRAIGIGLLLLATPFIAFVLIDAALTADAGPGGWLLLVVAPLSLLGSGIWTVAGDNDDVERPVTRFAEK